MIYLRNLALKNFKCFENLPSIEFGKITLITGANSTGKSSLLYSMLSLLQTEKFPMNYHLNGKYVSLGSFSEVVYNGDIEKEIAIDFTLVDDEVNITYFFHSVWVKDSNDQPLLYYFECKSDYFTFIFDNNRSASSTVYHLDYYPERNPHLKQNALLDVFQQLSTGGAINGEKLSISNKTLASEYVKFVTHETHLQNVCFDKNLNLKKNDDQIKVIKDMLPITLIFKEIEELLKLYNAQLNYMSSYRMPAERTYMDKPVVGGKINYFGEGFVNELLDWQEKNKERFTTLIDILRRLGLLYDISSRRTERGGFSVGVKVHEDSALVSLSDVGFGISQILPVIVGDLELSNHSTLFTSQPEIHLHPSVQADLGDYFVECANDGKRYFIETHSEYLLNRIRLNIVKGNLKEEDIRVYYLSQQDCQTRIHTITFTRSGQILGAPEEFFETYMIDTMDIALAAE